MPAPHEEQEMEPFVTATSGLGQGVHDDAPARLEKEPTAQETHSLEEDNEYVPAWHETQAVWLPFAKNPAPHERQAEAPRADI